MSNGLSEIIIKIRALFDRSGADAAKRALQETASVTKATAAAATQSGAGFSRMEQDAKKAGNETAQRIGDVKQAIGGLQGGIEGASGSLQGLVKLFPALAALAGPVAILSVAVAGLVKLLTYLQEKALAAFSALQKNQLDNMAASADRLAASYGKQRDELQRILDVRNRLNAAGDENTSASRRLEDAQAETDYQAVMSTAGSDEALKNELTAEYNLMKAQVAAARELEDSRERSARIEQETNLLLLQRQSLEAEYADKTQIANRLLEMQKHTTSEMVTTAQKGRWGLGGDKKTKAYAETSGDISTQLNATLDSMDALRKQINDIPVATQVNQIKQNTELLNQGAASEKGEQAGIAHRGVESASLDTEFARLNQSLVGSSAAFMNQMQSVVNSLLNQNRLTVEEMRRLNDGIEQQKARGRNFQ